METEILKKKFDLLSETIHRKHWKFFHRESIKNFILNIGLIKSNTERSNTANIINNCLDDVEINFEPDIDFSLYLFDTYLKYIVPTYENRLGFWPIPNRNALIASIAFVTVAFILLLNYIFFEVLFCLIVLVTIYKILNGFIKHKVYGFRY
ncbi:MAG: hypothetical protein ABIN97_05575 [Ginsengibacter sp.]